MQIDDKTYRLKDDQFYKESHPKKAIVLHFTAGHTASGAAATFANSKVREGTAYLVGENGQIYELFDPRYWALHIYRHKKQDPHGPVKYALEKETIGIEITNPGPLSLGKKESNKHILYTYYGKEWCTIDDVEMYVQEEYRNHFYWASFPPSQYSALLFLIPHLADLFGIDIYVNGATPERIGYWGLSALQRYRGVATHGNYRRDKLDIGPAFDWSRIGIHG